MNSVGAIITTIICGTLANAIILVIGLLKGISDREQLRKDTESVAKVAREDRDQLAKQLREDRDSDRKQREKFATALQNTDKDFSYQLAEVAHVGQLNHEIGKANHSLLNGGMTDALRTIVTQAQQLWELNKSDENKDKLDRATKDLRAHERNQSDRKE